MASSSSLPLAASKASMVAAAMVAAIEHSTNQGSQMNSDSKEERSSHKTSSKSPNKELLAGSSRREADREGWASDRERLGKWTPSSVEVGNYNLEL